MAAEWRAPVFTHVREVSLAGIQEAIALAAVTGAPLHIVHLNSMALGAIAVALEMVASAQAQGLDITTEVYPMQPEWIDAGVGSPVTMIESDGMPCAPGAHPRSAGTFARVLGRYVRKRGALTPMDARSQMTIRFARHPARRRRRPVRRERRCDRAGRQRRSSHSGRIASESERAGSALEDVRTGSRSSTRARRCPDHCSPHGQQ